MSNTQKPVALSVQFAEEKVVTGAATELVLGRTDLYFGLSKKTGQAYGPYTVVKHITKENGVGQLSAVIMRTVKQDSTAPNKAATESANDIDARMARLENMLGKVVDKLASNTVADNAINIPKRTRKSPKL